MLFLRDLFLFLFAITLFLRLSYTAFNSLDYFRGIETISHIGLWGILVLILLSFYRTIKTLGGNVDFIVRKYCQWIENDSRLVTLSQLAKQKSNAELLPYAIQQKEKQFLSDALNNKKGNQRPTSLFKKNILAAFILLLLPTGNFYNFSYAALSGNLFKIPKIELLSKLEAKRNTSHNVKFRFLVPDEENVKMKIYGENLPLKKDSTGIFNCLFERLVSDIDFQITYRGKIQKNYTLKCLDFPSLSSFSILTTPPKYTDIPQENRDNHFEIEVPEGTRVNYNFLLAHCDTVKIKNKECSTWNILPVAEGSVSFKINIVRDTQFRTILINENFHDTVKLPFIITSIVDEYPKIEIEEKKDTISETVHYFYGKLSDDYGFHSLHFVLKDDKGEEIERRPLPFSPRKKNQKFYYLINFEEFKGRTKEVSYYFEVADNDIRHGYKKTKTPEKNFIIPQDASLEKKQKELSVAVLENFKSAMSGALDLRHDIANMKKKSLQGGMSEWETKKMNENFTNKLKQIEKTLKKMTKTHSRETQIEEKLNKNASEVLKKKKELQKLMDDLLTDDLKKLMDEYQKLLSEKQDKNRGKTPQISKLNDLTDRVEKLNKRLERQLSLLRRMKIENQANRWAEKMKNLAQKQKELSKKIGTEKTAPDKLKETLERQQQELKQLSEQREELAKENQNLEKPYNLPNDKQQIKESQKSMEEQTRQIEKKNPQESAQQMEENAQRMENIAEQMKQHMEQNNQKQQNIEGLIHIVDNLLQISYEQEELALKMEGKTHNYAGYSENIKHQFQLKGKFKTLDDSLFQIAKQSPQLGSIISQKSHQLNQHFSAISKNLQTESNPNLFSKQGKIMTEINDLALILSEIIENTEKQQQMQQNGKGKTGENAQSEQQQGSNGEQKLESLKQMQQQMRQQLEDLISDMQKEEKQGQNAGNQQLMNEERTSELMEQIERRMGQALAQQEIMEQATQQLSNGNAGKVGKKAKEILKDVEKMLQKNKKDLISGNVTRNMIKRQNQIIKRLLEAEQAEREENQEKKRESTTAQKQFWSNPADYFPTEKENEITPIIPLNPIKMNRYYEKRHRIYLENLNKSETSDN